jgi:hypothetical protein
VWYIGIAVTWRAILVVKTLVILVGRLLLRKGWWVGTPLGLLVGDDTTGIRLGLIGMGRGEALAIEGL